MKIDRLILQGFKSFGERTVLEFGPGVTGIVGPNGSGKSNILEGLRWVVGARARELRSEEPQALLFHGSEARAPMPFAEVVLELSRGSERLSVSRRLDRDGEAEVRLGNKPSTLRAVERALAGAGLGRGGYAVIGQGEVGAILQSGPEVLLGYLEEAAGLKAVTLAAKAAHERLELAVQEMQTLRAEHARLQGALSEKATQAEAARQARALSAQILLLRHALLEAKAEEARMEAHQAEERIARLEAERRTLTEHLAQLQARKTQLQALLETLQADHARAVRQAESLNGERKLLRQERNHQADLLARLEREKSRLEAELARLEALPLPASPPIPEESLQERLAGAERLRAVEVEWQEAEAALRLAQTRYEAYLKAQATYDAQRQAFLQAQAERLRLEATVQQLSQDLAQATQQRQQAEAREKALRAELDRLVGQEGRLTAEARALRAEVERLEALLRSGADLGEGPRRVKEARLQGILGVVADLLEVPPGLEGAAEVALGARLQWVLTADDHAAQEAIEMLKQKGGRATFLPLTLLPPAPKPRRGWDQEPGVLGLARELVGVRGYPQVGPALFGETLILSSLEAALSLAKRHPDAPRMVTLEGELLEPSGALTGGKLQKGGQMLALRRRVREGGAEAERLEAELAQLARQTRRLREDLKRLDLPMLRQREQTLQAELRSLGANLERLPKVAAPEAPEPVEPPNRDRLEALLREREALRQGLQEAREVQMAWRHYREELARYQEAQSRIREAAQRIASLDLEREQIEARMAQLALQEAELAAKEGELGLAALEARLREARQTTRSLADEESRLLARTNALLAELEQSRITQARREAALEALQAERSELPPVGGELPKGSPRTLARQLSEAEAALAALGAVNHLAEAEQRDLADRAEALQTALREAEEVAGRLEAELKAVEREYQGRLEAAYGRFRNKFAEYAEALLGAEARLELLPYRGLRLVLRPAGKRTVDLNLLSMGERTMGALAFLFALSEASEEGRGLPVAVLDEVDAPLDEANILRFTEFLQRFKGETQFVLVTHQKRTMEACDALYGVTSERGMSRIYSIRREAALS
ncbi:MULTISPECIES: chromosome segregation SMC family protein [unclassified Meiothermus]|uniref:AAA family ATPase n=1 Tax=unclassified Meiothermus TaxID=370471 RepID=UPI000D7B94D7|nr:MULTISPECIES: chromosome segregation SMC family protein [unclassified Meiothermus]PZA06912.1 chromosome segregation protein SMC [Meiothermus sp. Pnk-1]RYM38307.1 chromosome segregation protein SMC [Meiothermus sp. PNK-Is4]